MIDTRQHSIESSSTTRRRITLFDSLPREFGPKKMWVDDAVRFKQLISMYNGVTDCYCSFIRQTIRKNEKDWGDALESGAILDKIFIDIDGKYGYECMLIAHEWLDKHNTLHRINNSGRWSKVKIISKFNNIKDAKKYLETKKINSASGFHIFYWISQEFEYKKNVLYNMQKDMSRIISKQLQTGWGVDTVEMQWKTVKDKTYRIDEMDLPMEQTYEPVDRQIWGNLLCMSRIPNTYNLKRKRYCIPLSAKMIESLTPEEIQEIAKKQNVLKLDDTYMGQNLLKVPVKFDTKSLDGFSHCYTSSPDTTPNPDVVKNMKIPLCIRKLISDSSLDYRLRFWVIVYFREKGMTMEEVQMILSGFLTPDKARHSIVYEKQVDRAFYGKQKDAYLPNCKSFRKLCGCKDKTCENCERLKIGNPVYA